MEVWAPSPVQDNIKDNSNKGPAHPHRELRLLPSRGGLNTGWLAHAAPCPAPAALYLSPRPWEAGGPKDQMARNSLSFAVGDLASLSENFQHSAHRKGVAQHGALADSLSLRALSWVILCPSWPPMSLTLTCTFIPSCFPNVRFFFPLAV